MAPSFLRLCLHFCQKPTGQQGVQEPAQFDIGAALVGRINGREAVVDPPASPAPAVLFHQGVRAMCEMPRLTRTLQHSGPVFGVKSQGQAF
tara:strand:+ start:2376 stop:2648 length:273 start_codon:yes stop_codon:yes gene_type:complete